jgi:hypothetical protein
MLDKIKAGKNLTQEEISWFLHQMVRDRAFPLIMSTKQIWYDNHPLIKVMAQFKTWSIRQTEHIWNDVLKYTIKTKDPTRLIGFVTGVLVAGEIYNEMRDWLYGKQESILSQSKLPEGERDIPKAILEDLLDGGLVGVVSDFSYGIYDWAKGPTFATAKNLGDALTTLKKEPELTVENLKKLTASEVAPYKQVQALYDKVKAKTDASNISQDYMDWRSKTWEWHQKNTMSPYEKWQAWSDRVIWGVQNFPPGENTLALEMFSRQVLLGDVEDAANYVEVMLERAKEPGDLKDNLTSIKQSMSGRSPLGYIAKEDRGKFLASLSEQDRSDIIALDLRYKTLSVQAIQKGYQAFIKKGGLRKVLVGDEE